MKKTKRSIIAFAHFNILLVLLSLFGGFLFINLVTSAILKANQINTITILSKNVNSVFSEILRNVEKTMDNANLILTLDTRKDINLNEIFQSTPIISDAEIISANGTVLFSTTESKGMDRSGEEFYQQQLIPGRIYWSDIFNFYITGDPVVAATKRYDDFYIRTYIDLVNLSDVAEAVQNDLGTIYSISIINDHGEYLYHNNNEFIYEHVQSDEVDLIQSNISNNQLTFSSIDHKSQVSVTFIEQLNWYVTLHVRNSDIYHTIKVSDMILLVAVTCISLILAFYYLRTLKIAKQILALSRQVEIYSNSLNDIPVIDTNFKEIDTLSQRFHDMSRSLKKTIELERKTELKFLRSQIQPHFINNSLNAIIAIMRNDIEKARALLIEFSTYLRSCYDFHSLDDVISISNELSYIKAYLSLAEARFQNKLTVVYEIDDVKIGVPPLILQPLVENAVTHGIRSIKSGFIVRVFIKNLGDCVRLGVYDNGPGIEKERLNRILSGDTELNSIGIFNINQRLLRMYNTALVFQNLPEGGFEVYMDIPISS